MPILPAEPDMYPEDLWDEVARPLESERRWFCLHTRPRQEKATARDLRAARVPFYLPQIVREDRTPAGRKTSSILPLFGGYMFLFGDDTQRVRALKGNRLVNVLEVADQDTLAFELRQIHQMLCSGLAIQPEPSPPVGTRIRIKSGPLAGLIGTVVRRGKRDHFVAVVKILGLGATVALEDWQVEILNE
jgi:transcription antitermination factor NusG